MSKLRIKLEEHHGIDETRKDVICSELAISQAPRGPDSKPFTGSNWAGSMLQAHTVFVRMLRPWLSNVQELYPRHSPMAGQ